MMWFLLLLWLTIALYCFSVKKYDYWKRKEVPHLKPVPILGNYGDFIKLKTFVGNVAKRICEKFPDEPYIGTYYGTEPALLVQDSELIKTILLKDFYYFHGREASAYSEREPMGNNIFLTHGDTWKVLRQNFSPLYTTAKMKNMFPLIIKCTRALEKFLVDEFERSNIINASYLMACFTVDCVASCGFGVEANAMQRNVQENPFKQIGDDMFARKTARGIKIIIRSMWPSLFYALGFHSYPIKVKHFFVKVFSETFEKRNYTPSSRNDFIDFAISLYNEKYISGDSILKHKTGESNKIRVKVDNNLLAAQCLSLFGAGFETSATTIALTLFEIAKNGEVQAKVLEEVDVYFEKHNHKLNYDCVTELPYLEACIDETLRLYPSMTILTREVMEDYTFPNGLRLEKGLRIHLPVYSIQRDPKYFPEPEKFRPERFLPDEKHKIKPFTYFPFGEGHRICMAMRFAKMQMLAGLVTIFKKYKIQLAEGMLETLDFDPRVIIARPMEDVKLRIIPRRVVCEIEVTDSFII